MKRKTSLESIVVLDLHLLNAARQGDLDACPALLDQGASLPHHHSGLALDICL